MKRATGAQSNNKKVFLQRDKGTTRCTVRMTSNYDCEKAKGFRPSLHKVIASAGVGSSNCDSQNPIWNAYRNIVRVCGNEFQTYSSEYRKAYLMVKEYNNYWYDQRKHG